MNCRQYLPRVKNEESWCFCPQAGGLENSNYQQLNSNYSGIIQYFFEIICSLRSVLPSKQVVSSR